MSTANRMEKFRNRLRCKIAIIIDMVLAGVLIIFMIGLDLIGLVEVYPEMGLDFTALPVISYTFIACGHICGLFLFLVGYVVLRGPCQLSPADMDTLPFESGIKYCGIWCSLEFLRLILLLLGLSFRLMVFSLVAFDDLTDFEVAKQTSFLLPITSILVAWSSTHKYKKELDFHLKHTLLPIHATAFQQF